MSVYDLSTSYDSVTEGLVAEVQGTLRGSVERIAHCLGQLDEDDVWWRPHPDMNAIGNLVLHLAGNVRQWIVAGVGGQPDTRRRQEEFDRREPLPKAELLAALRAAVEEACAVAARQTAASLLERRRIQAYETTVLTALFHAAAHFEGHTQEIVYVTRLRRGAAYRTLWTPGPGQR